MDYSPPTYPRCIDWPTPPTTFREWVWGDPMRIWQERRCAFCGFTDRLCRDHDHATGLIRGYLCIGCNSAEGFAPYTHKAWQMYREGCNPANILGIEEFWGGQGVTIVKGPDDTWPRGW